MSISRLSLYFFVIQLVFSIALLGSLGINNNLYARYHTMAIALFMLVTSLMGIYFSLKEQLSRIVADAWLILSIVTAYLAIQVSPFFNNPVKPLELTAASIVTIIWIADLYIAWRSKVHVLRL
ncbi:hypothetical protein [Vulcanisaeta souniana]|uniref:Uncharacterized protein n=1 Tax=Vulcanisaeta souniana JCM 11219 TaxID=1293586 RepID=A0A830EIJ8_9CREN|nr:hypothetical protein [Vulcanisaeta souniana]BDR91021.1 hypothetical protein Vsou_01140 [Vulcanisaeta souniana JCM 11219]GGI80059.1 hypothetical protein GCM10007112_16290 [Vulcanisaeta souniana JCM 11219]